MIHGTVGAGYEMVVPLSLRDSAGKEHESETVLDTGFNGFLSLPPSVIASLGLPWHSKSAALLAGGIEAEFDVYTATVLWDGAPRAIVVQAMDNDPLLGMRLLIAHDITARVKFDGSVRIEAIP